MRVPGAVAKVCVAMIRGSVTHSGLQLSPCEGHAWPLLPPPTVVGCCGATRLKEIVVVQLSPVRVLVSG